MVEMTDTWVPPLKELYVYVTDLCNCTCKHCWIVPVASSFRDRHGHFLDPATLETAILEAKPLGLAALKWTGGEPTICPDFPELLSLQKKHQLAGRLETNGMEVTAALAKLLLDSGVNQVSVSLDGAVPETHEAIRGVRGSHRRAVAGIRNLTAAGYRPQIIMSLMQENLFELEGLLELALSLGVGSVKLNIVQPTLRGEDIHASSLALSVRELLAVGRRVENELRPKYPFSIFFDLPMAFRSIRHILSGDGCSVCGIKRILGLLADGSYALCGIGENLQDMVFGKAGNGRLEAIWNEHPTLLKVRHGIPNSLKGICGECMMKSACLGACVAQNYYRSKDLLGAFWFCERAENEGLFPESRRAS